MVSKKDITGLDFTTIEEYFDYMVLSQINGQYRQLGELIAKLSTKQKKEAIAYLDSIEYSENEGMSLKKLLIENL